MGTDIHASVEVTESTDERSWVASFLKVALPRDYSLFSLLAGVRSHDTGVTALIPPKGLPSAISRETLSRLELVVDDDLAAVECENACTRAQAEAWVVSGTSRYLDVDQNRILDPDAFAVSWLRTDEVARVVNEYSARWQLAPTELSAVLAAMRICEAAKRPARLVLWFRG